MVLGLNNKQLTLTARTKLVDALREKRGCVSVTIKLRLQPAEDLVGEMNV